MMGTVAVKVLASLGVVVAGTTVAAASGLAPGLAVALGHVPTWTHANSVLTSIQNAFQSGGHPGSHSGHP